MLFDLHGKRRRVVQATYLTLAVLMGGGLVFFGIGGDVSGGLFDAFSERGGGSGNNVIDDRIEANEKKVKANPANIEARKDLVRDYYSLAAALPVGQDGRISADGQSDLKKAAANWEAYLASEPEKFDADLALTALQIYNEKALNDPKKAMQAARSRAKVKNDAESYLILAQTATAAGDKRTADLAGQKAVDLSPKGQRKAVEAVVERITYPQPAAAATGGAGATPAPASP